MFEPAIPSSDIHTHAAAVSGKAPSIPEVVKKDAYKKPQHNQTIQPKLTVGPPDEQNENEATFLSDPFMRIPDQNFIQRKCAHCEEEEKINRKTSEGITPFIQTKTEKPTPFVSGPLIESIQTSRGSGPSMDHSTQSFMGGRFGVDFGNVKVHTDGEAIEMNRELHAKAFTVGNDIYFNRGQYQPQSDEGKKLLAHELTHVVQQNRGVPSKLIQRACDEESNPARTVTCPEGATDVGRQAQGQPNALDARANAIIATATGSGADSTKALRVVHDMICSYMPSQASKVRKINYFSGEPGLGVLSVGSGASTRGDICVGNNFLNGTNRAHISRRLLQLAHELEHIDQYRSGLAGQQNRPEREFLAFYHEGLADEFIGTRRMSDATRRTLIDGALGQYNCFSAQLRARHQTKQQELLTRRQTVNGTSGNASTSPPSTCIPR